WSVSCEVPDDAILYQQQHRIAIDGKGEHRMRVGRFTALVSQFTLDKVLDTLKKLEIDTVELGTGNYPGDPHCKLSMVDKESELTDFKKKLADNGFSISALSCHGNPLHPNAEIAKNYQETSRKTILLAEKLGVP